MLLAAVLGCGPADPQVDAWVGAVKVVDSAHTTESCDEVPAPFEPPRKDVYLAVDRGVPDIATLYWCRAAEDCDEPIVTVDLAELTLDHAEGDTFATTSVGGSLCEIEWSQLTADQSGRNVSFTVRTGSVQVDDTDPGTCADIAGDHVGDDCQAVLELSGTRVE